MRLWIDNASAALRASSRPVLGAAAVSTGTVGGGDMSIPVPVDRQDDTTANKSSEAAMDQTEALVLEASERVENNSLAVQRKNGGSASAEVDDMMQSIFAGNVDVHPPSMFGHDTRTSSAGPASQASGPSFTETQGQPETPPQKTQLLVEAPAALSQKDRVAMERRLTHDSLQTGLKELQLSLQSDRSVSLMQHQQSTTGAHASHGLSPKMVQRLCFHFSARFMFFYFVFISFARFCLSWLAKDTSVRPKGSPSNALCIVHCDYFRCRSRETCFRLTSEKRNNS